MELRHLRYFVAVAEELSFTRAAVRLNMAQPPLSVQIRKLEEEVGAELLSREGRTISMTEAGRVFLQQARQTLVQAQQSIFLARRAASGEFGYLSIGYNTPAEFRVFPEVVPAFKERWPDVQLNFHSLTLAEQFEGLRRGELDLGFVWSPLPSDEFDAAALTEERLVAVVPANHRLAAQAFVSVKDLANERMVLFSPSLDPATFHEIERLFLRSKARLNVTYEVGSLLSAINFVAMGSACSLLADYTRAVKRDGVVYKPLRPNIRKTLAIIKNKRSSDLANAFFQYTVGRLSA